MATLLDHICFFSQVAILGRGRRERHEEEEEEERQRLRTDEGLAERDVEES